VKGFRELTVGESQHRNLLNPLWRWQRTCPDGIDKGWMEVFVLMRRK